MLDKKPMIRIPTYGRIDSYKDSFFYEDLACSHFDEVNKFFQAILLFHFSFACLKYRHSLAFLDYFDSVAILTPEAHLLISALHR